MARRPHEGREEVKSLGRQFVDSDSYKSLTGSAGQRGKANLEIKATITSATTDAAGSAGDLVQATRLPGIVGGKHLLGALGKHFGEREHKKGKNGFFDKYCFVWNFIYWKQYLVVADSYRVDALFRLLEKQA